MLANATELNKVETCKYCVIEMTENGGLNRGACQSIYISIPAVVVVVMVVICSSEQYDEISGAILNSSYFRSDLLICFRKSLCFIEFSKTAVTKVTPCPSRTMLSELRAI